MDANEVIRTISQHPWTVLVIDAQGQIKEYIPFEHNPPIEWTQENRLRFKGCAVREIPQQQLSVEELEKIVVEAVKYIEMFQRYERD
jgi:hypothetical protein